jgi:hypothetical protein
MATETETEMQAVNERLAIATLTAHVHAIRTLLAAVLDGAVASGLIERQRGMIGPSLLDALDALDLAGEFLAPTEPGLESHPKLGDVDVAVWTVRDSHEEIVAEFRSEEEALTYGSHLANANPDELYEIVVGRWKPIPKWQTPRKAPTEPDA